MQLIYVLEYFWDFITSNTPCDITENPIKPFTQVHPTKKNPYLPNVKVVVDRGMNYKLANVGYLRWHQLFIELCTHVSYFNEISFYE